VLVGGAYPDARETRGAGKVGSDGRRRSACTRISIKTSRRRHRTMERDDPIRRLNGRTYVDPHAEQHASRDLRIAGAGVARP
jgi:hypothetical protein